MMGGKHKVTTSISTNLRGSKPEFAEPKPWFFTLEHFKFKK